MSITNRKKKKIDYTNLENTDINLTHGSRYGNTVEAKTWMRMVWKPKTWMRMVWKPLDRDHNPIFPAWTIPVEPHIKATSTVESSILKMPFYTSCELFDLRLFSFGPNL
ncbi:hypothetical protein CEXT_133711 [Caerostris extrusa]|uniref:Uncharacterized protein n=1 Tax=Caerostris extrusa TaxID=172846 RepID=A0AAV4SCV2_CAEEX|nr:hypothetical protein CEXT_133711 [Caerostris extrusa]